MWEGAGRVAYLLAGGEQRHHWPGRFFSVAGHLQEHLRREPHEVLERHGEDVLQNKINYAREEPRNNHRTQSLISISQQEGINSGVVI